MAMLMLLGISSSLAGEFPRPTRVSDISGTWEATSLDRYVRLSVHENGKGTVIVVGVGNQIDIFTIRDIAFGNDSFDFTIRLAPSSPTANERSYRGVLWFGVGLLLFDQRTEKPNADPPLMSLLREGTFNTLRQAAQDKARELGK
jgi:hypothetical protein